MTRGLFGHPMSTAQWSVKRQVMCILSHLQQQYMIPQQRDGQGQKNVAPEWAKVGSIRLSHARLEPICRRAYWAACCIVSFLCISVREATTYCSVGAALLISALIVTQIVHT